MPYRRRCIVTLLILTFCCALPALGATRKAKVVRVPKDAKDLPTAIRLVKDGDVIELAGGTYTAPNGFSISNLGKAFTIRAVQGATVILDGKGKGPILRFKNGNRSRGKRVTFERLTFQNGVTTTEGEGGAVTLSAADARFVDCRFLASSASGRTTGGGAVRVLAGSEATFVRGEWQGNSSANRGGALEINFSTVAIEGGSFVENRTNLPGSKPNSSGGAIYLLDGTLRISDARFERNQAGFVGGAIYAFGHWSDPVDVPKSDMTVVRSTFVENQACCSAASQGGAIHVENQTTLRLQHSQLLANRAQLGGAVSDYRAIVELTGSQLQGNQALQAALGGGGAIFASSNDTAGDAATNRRPIALTINDSLLQGATGQPAAHTGGCVLAGGDASRTYGDNGVLQMGTVDENRARVEVRRSVFSDCDVQRDPAVGGGFGGALQVNLANLLLEGSMVMASDARGDGAGGGGLSVQGESVAAVVRTTFAGNSAQRWGGAFYASGSTLQVSQCRFFGNDVRPGFPKPLGSSQGAALYTTPFRPETKPERWRNVSGVVADSIFSDNLGLAVWDAEVQSGPINEVRYDNNQFFETTFGDTVYADTKAASSGLNVASLNRLVVGSVDKSLVDNLRLFASPVAGSLLAAPGVVGTGAPAAAATFLHYAWSGRSATLDGKALTARSGLVQAGPGSHSLVVDGTPAATVSLGTATCANGAVCLASGRFEVRVEGASLLAREADTAFFSLPGGETLAVQVLDQRDKNGHYWVVRGVSNMSGVSALSGHTLEITDTATGMTRTWADLPSGEDAEVDSTAFPAD